MNIKVEDLGAFGIVIGIIGVAYGVWQNKKSNDIAKKLDVSLQDLEKKTSVDIREDVVNKAMNNAVEHQVRAIVTETAENVRNDIKKEVKKKINKEIEENLDAIHENVEDKIEELVASIDEQEFVSKMQEEAKKAMLAKYNSSLDGVLGDFKDRFKDISSMWNYMARCAGSAFGQKTDYNGGNFF